MVTNKPKEIGLTSDCGVYLVAILSETELKGSHDTEYMKGRNSSILDFCSPGSASKTLN